VLTAGLSACETTEQESARLGREAGAQSKGPTALKIAHANRAIHASEVTLLSSEGRSAVAVRLTSHAAHSEAAVPLLLDVTDAKGKTVYSNATGVEPSLQSLALLRGQESAWWVDDQVLTSAPAKSAKVTVGKGHAAPTTARLQTTAVHASSQSGLPVLSGKLVNGSAHKLEQVSVFAVALSGGRVVGAGRAVVASLAGHGSAQFQVFIVGRAAGAKLELTAAASGS
jgi:hypothetical protein